METDGSRSRVHDDSCGFYARPPTLPEPRPANKRRCVSKGEERDTCRARMGPTAAPEEQGPCLARRAPAHRAPQPIAWPLSGFPDDDDEDVSWREEVDDGGGRVFTLCDGTMMRSEAAEAGLWSWRHGPARRVLPNRRLDPRGVGAAVACSYAAPRLCPFPCALCHAHIAALALGSLPVHLRNPYVFPGTYTWL
jgi:hypothetical protein